MTARKVNIGLVWYRGADGFDRFGLHGADVDVHPDDLDRFDGVNGVPEDAPAVDGAVLAPAVVEKPAGNASEDEWRAYALTQGRTDADLDGLRRNDIRDLFA